MKSPKQALDFAPYFTSRAVGQRRDLIMMERVYQLRFEVYCLECAFLDPQNYPEHQESDEYDADSAHFCSYNTSEDLVGYVRLVSHVNGKFPFQIQGADVYPEAQLPPPELCGEISRLMVRNDYRRRPGDLLAGVSLPPGTPEGVERRSPSPQILLSLYRQMYQHSVANGTRYWYAAMERSLARALMRFNFAFKKVGPEIDYYGPVAPYLADLRELESALERSNPLLLAWMQQPDVNHS